MKYEGFLTPNNYILFRVNCQEKAATNGINFQKIPASFIGIQTFQANGSYTAKFIK